MFLTVMDDKYSGTPYTGRYYNLPLPINILKVLRGRRGLDKEDSSSDHRFCILSPDELLSEVCIWEFGYDWSHWFRSASHRCGCD